MRARLKMRFTIVSIVANVAIYESELRLRSANLGTHGQNVIDMLTTHKCVSNRACHNRKHVLSQFEVASKPEFFRRCAHSLIEAALGAISILPRVSEFRMSLTLQRWW
jgi:hypothetical protein